MKHIRWGRPRATRPLILAIVGGTAAALLSALPAAASGRAFDTIAVTADGSGYAAVATTGEVYAFGTVVPRGNPTGFTGSIVDVAVTANGQGYAAISSVGQVHAYGTAVPHGNGAPGSASAATYANEILDRSTTLRDRVGGHGVDSLPLFWLSVASSPNSEESFP